MMPPYFKPHVTVTANKENGTTKWKFKMTGRSLNVLHESHKYLKVKLRSSVRSKPENIELDSAKNTTKPTRPTRVSSTPAIPNGSTKKTVLSKQATKEQPPPPKEIEIKGVVGLLDSLIPVPTEPANPFQKSKQTRKPNSVLKPKKNGLLLSKKNVAKVSESCLRLPLQRLGSRRPGLTKSRAIDIENYILNNLKPLNQQNGSPETKKAPVASTSSKLKSPKVSPRKTRSHFNHVEIIEPSFTLIGRRICKGNLQYLVQWNL